MKRIAACLIFSGLLVATSASAAHTVAEACGECVMPDGMEKFSGYEVKAEAYFAIEIDSIQGVSLIMRRIVAREVSDLATIILIDQVVTETSPLFSHIGPGPIIRIVVVEEDGSVTKPYEWGLQDVVEFAYLIKHGRRGYQW